MSAILLHSGKTEHFRALGDTGQPVYHSALQLRKVISRRLPGKERHLAVPQRDQQGEGVDWYSDIQGDVIPWSSATEGEREDARIQLEAFRQKIIALNQAPLEDGQSGDHEVFSRLVKWVCHFPDEGFVYLVDGTPVITFWGFIHPEADRHANPLLCLYPPATPAMANPATLSAPGPIVEPVPEPEPPVEPARPWWRRWWWLLPLILLLLGLLLLGLRACAPSANTPGLTTSSPEVSTPSVAFPGSLWEGFDIWPFNRWGSGSTTTPGLALPSLGSDLGAPTIDGSLPEASMPGISVPDMGLPGMTGIDGQPRGLDRLDEAAPSDLPESGGMPDAAGLPEGMVPPEIPAERLPVAGSPGELPAEPGTTRPPAQEPLTLPDDAQDGAADFLNGNWRGAGVMDSQTGRPLQVTYVFDQGEGHMYIQRGGSDGMTCAGPVAANMQGGQLQVEAQERARCEDGSHYEMPRVQCHQADGETASCAASYDDEPFPMQLRKAS